MKYIFIRHRNLPLVGGALHRVILVSLQSGQQLLFVEHLSVLCAARKVSDAKFSSWWLVRDLEAVQNKLGKCTEETTIRTALNL